MGVKMRPMMKKSGMTVRGVRIGLGGVPSGQNVCVKESDVTLKKLE